MTTEYTKNFGLAMPDFRTGPWHDLLNSDIEKIDQIIYGALSGLGTPAWTNATLYEVGNQVIDSDSATTWVCNVEHTSAATGTFLADRTAHPTYWVQLLAGFAPRGEWENATEYRPYDLAYESASGIFAQCKTQHVSNATGTIDDDAAYWYWIVNFSESGLSDAIAVTYTPTAPITGINVQQALDQIAGFVTALNNVNVSQGNQITTLQNTDSSYNTRLTNLESKDTTHDTLIASLQTAVSQLQTDLSALTAAVLKIAANQNIGPGGFSVTSKAWGNQTGTLQMNPLTNGNYQSFTNVGSITILAPTVDGGVDLLMTNGAGAVIPAMSGFTVNPTNAGDPFTNTNGHRFLISMRRISGIATYAVKALQ